MNYDFLQKCSSLKSSEVQEFFAFAQQHVRSSDNSLTRTEASNG